MHQLTSAGHIHSMRMCLAPLACLPVTVQHVLIGFVGEELRNIDAQHTVARCVPGSNA